MSEPAAPPPAPSNSPFVQPVRTAPPSRGAPDPGSLSSPPAPRAGAITDAHYEGLAPDQQDRYSRVRRDGPDGGSQWVSRDALPIAEPKPTTSSTAPAAGDKVKVGDMEVTQVELQEFFQSKADAELRKATLPATPADYQATLPEDFKAPPGVEFKFDEKDPALADARAWAHKQGFSQAQFSEMISLHAAMQAREAANYNAAHAAEVAKLGPNGTMRVTAIENFLRGHVGDDLAKGMRTMLVTAGIVSGFERLMSKFSSQGAASFSQAHRVPGDPAGRVNEATYNAMSHAERLNYARQFPQDQFQRTG